jgi:GNAT superfamily N-acetyltransferase
VAVLRRCSREALFHRFHGFTDGVAYTKQLAERGDQETVVAWSGGQCVGFATLAISGDRADVGVLVEDCWQRQGVGTTLFRAVIEPARRRRLSRVHADLLAEDAFLLPALSRIGNLHTSLAWGAYSVELDLGGSPRVGDWADL